MDSHKYVIGIHFTANAKKYMKSDPRSLSLKPENMAMELEISVFSTVYHLTC